MKLFLIHCGFYDEGVSLGLYESHVNYFVVAENFEEARKKAKLIPEFKAKKMHIDGLQEINAVDGFNIKLEESLELNGQSILPLHKHRSLAPSTPTN